MDVRNACLYPVSVPSVSGVDYPIFRCGKCVNCIKVRKNELAVRTYREFNGQSVAFLTFTYSDENCPIQITDFKRDESDADILVSSYIVRGSDTSYFQRAPFQWKMNKDCKPSKRYLPYLQDTFIGFQSQFYTTYYEDLKLALKRFRIKHPRVLKQFIAVPEYGSLTYRPHYHMLVFGLTDSQVDDLVAEWPYGNVDVDRCKDNNKPNSPTKISQYIAKYCVKGKFDCPYIAERKCRKPRRAISQGFGLGRDFEQLREVVLATKELGITDPWLDIELSDKQLSLLVSRRSFKLRNESSGDVEFIYKLPRIINDKIFKYVYKSAIYKDRFGNKQIWSCRVPMSHTDRLYYKGIKDYCKETKQPFEPKYHTMSSPLQKKIANYILVDLVKGVRRKAEQLSRSFTPFAASAFPSLLQEDYLKNLDEVLSNSYAKELEMSSYY